MPIDSTIFRSYDIRGIVDTQINPSVAYRIGRAFGQYLKGKSTTVTLGRDSRLSSEELLENLSNGLRVEGIDVVDLGSCTTPLLSYACLQSSGVMVTASHNPVNYNGFKFIINGEIFDQLPELLTIIEAMDDVDNQEQLAGSYKQHCIRDTYVDELVNNIELKQKYRIIIDGSNSPAGLLATTIFQRLGCIVGAINLELDGNFPGHCPDTGKEQNFEMLCKEITARGADFGFMFDGDGDRCVAVSHSSQIVWPDQMLALMSEDVLRQKPQSTIIYDIKCSNQVAIGIEQQGGTAVMSKTGRSNIYKKLRETNAELAGEYSGHFFFRHRWLTTDDAIYAACRLVEGCEKIGLSLQDRVNKLATSHRTPELKIGVDDQHKHPLISYLIDAVKGKVDSGTISTLDGLRIDYKDGWGLIRPSNTTPALTLRFEAQTEKKLQDMVQFFIDNLNQTAQQHNMVLHNTIGLQQ